MLTASSAVELELIMLPKRKRHACMLASIGAAPGGSESHARLLAWLPRLRNARALRKNLSNASMSHR